MTDQAALGASATSTAASARPADRRAHPLAATLDGLLGRLAAGLRREQRFSAELSHELRTPLARMNAQAQLALAEDLPTDQRDAWSAVLRSSAEMAQTLDALLAGARADASSQPGVADARVVADAVAERHAPLAAEHGVRIDVRAPVAPLRAGAEAQLLERLLAPLVDNACRYASTEVVIAVGGAGAASSTGQRRRPRRGRGRARAHLRARRARLRRHRAAVGHRPRAGARPQARRRRGR